MNVATDLSERTTTCTGMKLPRHLTTYVAIARSTSPLGPDSKNTGSRALTIRIASDALSISRTTKISMRITKQSMVSAGLAARYSRTRTA